MFFDTQSLLLTLPALGFSLWAQWRVRSTFHRFAEVGVRSGLSGAEAAAAVMRSAGVHGVKIERHQGFLSDHYDPLAKALRLSPHVYDGQSISAIPPAMRLENPSVSRAAKAPLLTRMAILSSKALRA